MLLVDKDTCKQFQKQNRQRTALCLDGNTWRTEMKLLCGCSAVSLLCYNHFIINFQDYFTVTLSISNMNTEYLVFLGGNFEQAENKFYNSHLVRYFISWFRFYIFRKIFNLIFIPFTVWIQSHYVPCSWDLNHLFFRTQALRTFILDGETTKQH